ncbi:MAG: pantetheine-phosphate adenylyltransferase [Oscillospiraceae bacterium]|nr:pantetheine-phosphate adenylyltransferase [Oscillospiraceae bacterium]
MKTAVCPGSFDPITAGHLDLIERAAQIFDEVIVCVAINSDKRTMFTSQERLEMARVAVQHLPNVRAELSEGLLADFARENNACALVKGVRNGMDLDWEYQLAQINRDLMPQLDTILLPARPSHLHISSTMVRDMIRYHQKLDHYLPAGVLAVLEKFRDRKEQ